MNNYRLWGKPPYKVAVVHGGPGGPGQVAPVARELASSTGVIEPLQTKDSLDGQVEELASVVKTYAVLPVMLVGWSHGATLSFIVAAKYPEIVKKLVMIGAPSFEEKYRENLYAQRLLRLKEQEREEVFKLEKSIWESSGKEQQRLLKRLFSLYARAETYAPLPHKDEVLEYQLNINIVVGSEVRRITAGGALLDLAEKIKCPVTAIHGDYDLHLAEGVRIPLSKTLKDFKFILLEKCGHAPWLEKFARDEFFRVLCSEIG